MADDQEGEQEEMKWESSSEDVSSGMWNIKLHLLETDASCRIFFFFIAWLKKLQA